MNKQRADELIKNKISKEKLEELYTIISNCSNEIYFDIISSIAYDAMKDKNDIDSKEIQNDLMVVDKTLDPDNPFFELNDLWKNLDNAIEYISIFKNRLYPEDNRMDIFKNK